jgi:hypothetical protein
MKLRRFSKRAAYVTSAAIAALLVAGVAFAYFTSTGSGTGTATVGTSADNIEVTGTVTDLLYPDGPGAEVTFTATNPEAFDQKLSTIELSGVTTTAVGCDTDVFHMADVVVGPEGNLAPNATNVALTATGTLYMDDNGLNQDDCKNATLDLTFTTS